MLLLEQSKPTYPRSTTVSLLVEAESGRWLP
jgi:hypothetical protein